MSSMEAKEGGAVGVGRWGWRGHIEGFINAIQHSV